jgi:hypothetical protein
MLYPILLYFRKSTASWKLPRFRPLVLPVGRACRIRWVWSIDGMILTGENRILADKPVQVPLWPPKILHGLTWNRTGTSALRGRRLTDWDTARTELLLPWIVYVRTAIFWVITQRVVVISYHRFGTIYRVPYSGVCHETSLKITTDPCVRTQKNAVVIYFVEEDWNHVLIILSKLKTRSVPRSKHTPFPS